MGGVLAPSGVGLTGKVVVVTGAGAGLGAAYARAIAAAGAVVVVNDVTAAAADGVAAGLRAGGARATAFAADVRDGNQAAALIDHAVERFGRLDGLVNNAGVRPEGPAWSEPIDQVRRAVEINLLGTIQCGIPALAVMRVQGSGSIVNASSRAQQGIPTSATYAATKGAVASLTYSWAIDLHPFGVRVNAIAPQAGTGTRRSGPRSASEPTADQMAPLVVYLLGDRSRAVTGQVIRLGGHSEALALGLMTHPRNGFLYRSAAGWDAEAIAEAFDGSLSADLEPVGADGLAVANGTVNGGRFTRFTDDGL